jgi:hypothetical protein
LVRCASPARTSRTGARWCTRRTTQASAHARAPIALSSARMHARTHSRTRTHALTRTHSRTRTHASFAHACTHVTCTLARNLHARNVHACMHHLRTHARTHHLRTHASTHASTHAPERMHASVRRMGGVCAHAVRTWMDGWVCAVAQPLRCRRDGVVGLEYHEYVSAMSTRVRVDFGASLCRLPASDRAHAADAGMRPASRVLLTRSHGPHLYLSFGAGRRPAALAEPRLRVWRFPV